MYQTIPAFDSRSEKFNLCIQSCRVQITDTPDTPYVKEWSGGVNPSDFIEHKSGELHEIIVYNMQQVL